MQKAKDHWKASQAKKIKIKPKKNKTPKVGVEDVEKASRNSKKRNITDPEQVKGAAAEGMLSPGKGQDKNEQPWSGSSGRETATGSGQSVPEPLGSVTKVAETPGGYEGGARRQTDDDLAESEIF